MFSRYDKKGDISSNEFFSLNSISQLVFLSSNYRYKLILSEISLLNLKFKLIEYVNYKYQKKSRAFGIKFTVCCFLDYKFVTYLIHDYISK